MDLAEKLKGLEPDTEEYIKILKTHLSDTRAKKRKQDNKKRLMKRKTKDEPEQKKPKTDGEQVVEASGLSTSDTDVSQNTSRSSNKNPEKSDATSGVTSDPSVPSTLSQVSSESKGKRKEPISIASDSESDSSDDSESDEDEEDAQPKGVKIFEISDFDSKKLTLLRTDGDTFSLAYNGDSRIYIKSGVYMGDIVTYESKYSSSVLVKKGDILELMRKSVEKLLGKNRTVKFYGKNESSCASFFPETLVNMEKQKCINLLENDTPVLLPIAELHEKTGCFTVVLKAGKITKTKGKQYTWKLSIVEAEIKPIPKEYSGYFEKVKGPRLSFFS